MNLEEKKPQPSTRTKEVVWKQIQPFAKALDDWFEDEGRPRFEEHNAYSEGEARALKNLDDHMVVHRVYVLESIKKACNLWTVYRSCAQARDATKWAGEKWDADLVELYRLMDEYGKAPDV
jgi:hypothetical protein